MLTLTRVSWVRRGHQAKRTADARCSEGSPLRKRFDGPHRRFKMLDKGAQNHLLTDGLSNRLVNYYGRRPPQPHLLRPRGSHPPGDPGAARLGRDSVTELAEPFEMSLPAISKHLKVLERAGLIARGREAQWRPCRLEAGPLKGCRRLAGTLSPILGTEPRSPGGLPARNCKARRSDMAGSISATADRELVVTRVIDAPRRLVFKAWTQPEHMARWWGPRASPRSTATWTSASAAPTASACARRRAPSTGSTASIAKSSSRSASSSPSPGRTPTAIRATNCSPP